MTKEVESLLRMQLFKLAAVSAAAYTGKSSYDKLCEETNKLVAFVASLTRTK